MNAVKIRGLEIAARHGVYDFEKSTPQLFVIDADLYTDFYSAAKYDDLNATVNYSQVCNTLIKIATENTFNLIETLAYSCANALMGGFPLSGLSITVYKPEAPMKVKFSNVGVTVTLERERAFLSIGSSLGDKKGYLDKAVKLLGATQGITVKKISSYIETEPYGGVAENKFLNCAAEISTWLPPLKLLEEIHRIEAECGRERLARWGDRTLDIDIIFYGGKIIREDALSVPHPEYSKRDFVLIPLKEIAPEFVCPLTFKKINKF
ncbi:MAG: 2-amino-4-hydroxy-6-hydroxymethyldihydropteridine diphosphokinase [Clostridia bacterium]|nr:2-amino-4-hydroxy-6-hydroxymethyldihydropteridine diphosphokinase [Clostridia bacterium]